MPRLLPLPILCLALLLSACSGTAGDGQSHTPPPTLSDAEIIAAIGSIDPVVQSLSWEQEMLTAINQARDDHGDGSDLSWNDELAGAATYYAIDMDENGASNHIGSVENNQLKHRLAAADYDYHYAGENIAWGYTSVSEVMEAWMDSPGHRANILNPNFTEVGLARVDVSWVQVFGRPSVMSLKNLEPVNQ